MPEAIPLPRTNLDICDEARRVLSLLITGNPRPREFSALMRAFRDAVTVEQMERDVEAERQAMQRAVLSEAGTALREALMRHVDADTAEAVMRDFLAGGAANQARIVA